MDNNSIFLSRKKGPRRAPVRVVKIDLPNHAEKLSQVLRSTFWNLEKLTIFLDSYLLDHEKIHTQKIYCCWKEVVKIKVYFL